MFHKQITKLSFESFETGRWSLEFPFFRKPKLTRFLFLINCRHPHLYGTVTLGRPEAGPRYSPQTSERDKAAVRGPSAREGLCSVCGLQPELVSVSAGVITL